jgi:hypothetical protein
MPQMVAALSGRVLLIGEAGIQHQTAVFPLPCQAQSDAACLSMILRNIAK